MGKIAQLTPKTISQLPSDIREIVEEHRQDEAEFMKIWGDLPQGFKSEFLKDFGKNGKFFISGVEVETNFLDEVDEALAQKIKANMPEAAQDWGEKYIQPGTAQPSPTKSKIQLETIVKGYQIKLKRATTESDKQTIQKLINGYFIAIKRSK